MKRYAFINRSTGHVQGVEYGEDAQAAAGAMQVKVDGRWHKVELLPMDDSTDRGYDAYKVEDGFTVGDGQDPEVISAVVDHHKKVAVVLVELVRL